MKHKKLHTYDKFLIIAGLIMAVLAGRWTLTEYTRVTVKAQSTKVIQSKLGPLKPGNNADDPAIWIHPTDRSKSLMFLSDKDTGIFVYDFTGNQIQHVDFGTTLNNIDVRKGFQYGGRTIDILAGNLRATGKLAVLEIKPNWTQGNAVTILSDDASSGNSISSDSYGFTLYKRKTDGAMFVFDKSKNSNPIVQWRIDGSAGTIVVTKVREFSGIGVAEGFVADDELGFVYFVEEGGPIHKYNADPNAGNQKLSTFGTSVSTPDREGIALYACNDGTGYLVLSSQGSSTFPVFTREGANSHVLTFVAQGSSGTDGLDVSSWAVPGFTDGFLIIHNDPSMNYFLYDWKDLGLKVCVDGGAGGSPTATPVPTVPTTATLTPTPTVSPTTTPSVTVTVTAAPTATPTGTCTGAYDFNCDNRTNLFDVGLLINRIFTGTSGGTTGTPSPTPTGSVAGVCQVTAVTASADDGNVPANAIDGNLSTRWSASGDGQWIQFDMGSVKPVSNVSIAWYLGDVRRSRYDILVSADASSWTTVVTNKQSGGTSANLEDNSFPSVQSRYVKIVGHENTNSTWNSITEVRITGCP